MIKETIKRDYPKVQSDDWVVWDSSGGKDKKVDAVYDSKGNRLIGQKLEGIFYKINFLYATIFFLCIVYPAYLILKFIVWAILVLRQNGTTI
jgi:hypothetical protein